MKWAYDEMNARFKRRDTSHLYVNHIRYFDTNTLTDQWQRYVEGQGLRILQYVKICNRSNKVVNLSFDHKNRHIQMPPRGSVEIDMEGFHKSKALRSYASIHVSGVPSEGSLIADVKYMPM